MGCSLHCEEGEERGLELCVLGSRVFPEAWVADFGGQKARCGGAFWPFVSLRLVHKSLGIKPLLRRVCADGVLRRDNSWFLNPILAIFYYDLRVPQLATNVLSVHSVETDHDKKEVDGAHYWSSY